MKKITKFLSAALLTVGVLFFTSCVDPCKDVECLNGGVCDEGTCICATGYEGDDCSVESRTKFIGSWSFLDACFTTQNASTITTSAQAVERVIISNILGTSLGGNAYAIIDGTSITIPSQTVVDVDSDSWTIEGVSVGNLVNNGFTINVKYTFGPNSQTCLLTFTKQ